MKKGYFKNVVNEGYVNGNTSNKTQFEVEVEQNGGEYYGTVTITASRLKKVGHQSVLADGVLIEFDELITRIGRK